VRDAIREPQAAETSEQFQAEKRKTALGSD